MGKLFTTVWELESWMGREFHPVYYHFRVNKMLKNILGLIMWLVLIDTRRTCKCLKRCYDDGDRLSDSID